MTIITVLNIQTKRVGSLKYWNGRIHTPAGTRLRHDEDGFAQSFRKSIEPTQINCKVLK